MVTKSTAFGHANTTSLSQKFVCQNVKQNSAHPNIGAAIDDIEVDVALVINKHTYVTT